MKALNYQEPQKAGHDCDISPQVSSQQRLCSLEKPQVSAEKNIDDVEPNGRKHPGQGWRGSDF